MLGISVDNIFTLKAFAEQYKLTYPLLSDFRREVVKLYGVMYDDPQHPFFRMARRSYFIIDREGRVRFKHVLEDPSNLLPHEVLFKVLREIKR